MNVENQTLTQSSGEPNATTGTLEHVNVTVSDPDRTAQLLIDIFGWHIRWSGASIHDGYTVHVGNADDYVALYRGPKQRDATSSYALPGGLNHIGVRVSDLDATERRVIAAGYEPRAHADYEPGRRFYFYDHDGIEFEVVSYA